MTTKYRYSCPERAPCLEIPESLRIGNGQCCYPRAPGSAIPESMRVDKEKCPTAYVATQSGVVVVPVSVAEPLPVVDVGTVSASLTTRQRSTNVINAALDPYNPATRFSQYFPPAPPPLVCPTRWPTNEPKASTVCIPPSRFQGST